MGRRVHKLRVRREVHAADVNLLNIRTLVLKAIVLNEITKGGVRTKKRRNPKSEPRDILFMMIF